MTVTSPKKTLEHGGRVRRPVERDNGLVTFSHFQPGSRGRVLKWCPFDEVPPIGTQKYIEPRRNLNTKQARRSFYAWSRKKRQGIIIEAISCTHRLLNETCALHSAGISWTAFCQCFRKAGVSSLAEIISCRDQFLIHFDSF